MKLEAVELRRIRLSLVAPFETSFGVQTARDILLLKAITSEGDGWGECVAGEEPTYSSEYVDAAQHVLIHHLLPRVFDQPSISAPDVATVLRPVHGHHMAKATIEMAVLDAELRTRGESFGHYFGAVRQAVDCGVSVGIHASIPELLETVGAYVEQGYRRIKLKIKPGWDVEPVRAVRERFGDIPLQVDANTAYSLSHAKHLADLDQFGLLLIEQPLPEEQVLAHAELAKTVRTPICLDESITSVQAAADAIQLGRAGNVAMAAMSNFTLPGDTSASGRYYRRDITNPFVLHDGRLTVPTAPGLGVEVDHEFLDEITYWKDTVSAPRSRRAR